MVFCLCCACLMTFYAMLYGLLAKSRYNPGTLVLNLTVLIYFFFLTHHLFLLFCLYVAGVGYLCALRKTLTNAVLFRYCI